METNAIDKFLCWILMVLVVGLLIMGMAVSLGTVKEETSFGFHEILNIIGFLASGIIGILAGRKFNLKPPEDQKQADSHLPEN